MRNSFFMNGRTRQRRKLGVIGLVAGIGLTLSVGLGGAWAQDRGWPVDAKLRLQWEERRASATGTQGGAATAALELRSSAAHWNLIAMLQHQGDAAPGQVDRAWMNELSASVEGAGWQFSAGKKIVAWDVGYAFRPNDMVQQEERRTLVATTPEGRGVLMAERFDLDSAWSLVYANPTHERSATGAQEPALATRLYQRQGAVDWHGFARWGARTGASLGMAAAWVASDALEVHASLRALRNADLLMPSAATANGNPVRPGASAPGGSTTQALVGATWTHISQFSVLSELWWDGTARPKALQRNVYVRLSWEHDHWQPSLDLLYHPADGGQLWTLALSHTGDRIQIQGGLRMTHGPADALMRQQPSASQAYLMLSRAF